MHRLSRLYLLELCLSICYLLVLVLRFVFCPVLPGENQALVRTIPFCGGYPGPRFKDKFPSANQMDGISKGAGDKMVAS